MKALWTPALLAFWLILQHLPCLAIGENPGVHTVNFEVKEGLILVKATIEGKEGTFIFDTGAPTLVLNSRLFEGEQSDWKASGVNGNVSVKELLVRKFEWGSITKKHLQAVISDLTHLEKALHQPLMGLIGYEVIRARELYIDYENNEIQLYKPNKSGLHKTDEPKEVIDFEMLAHLPIIVASIGEQTLRLGLDTGAEANLLCSQNRVKLSRHNFSDYNAEELRGMDQQIQTTHAAVIKCTSIEQNNFLDMKYVFADFTRVNEFYKTSIDGLLGFPFFSSCKISINYKKKEIYIWESSARCYLNTSTAKTNPKKAQLATLGN